MNILELISFFKDSRLRMIKGYIDREEDTTQEIEFQVDTMIVEMTINCFNKLDKPTRIEIVNLADRSGNDEFEFISSETERQIVNRIINLKTNPALPMEAIFTPAALMDKATERAARRSKSMEQVFKQSSFMYGKLKEAHLREEFLRVTIEYQNAEHRKALAAKDATINNIKMKIQ